MQIGKIWEAVKKSSSNKYICHYMIDHIIIRIRIRIRIYLLARRNLLWDILRLPSSRRAALSLYVILTLWRGRGANQPPYALLHRSSPRYALLQTHHPIYLLHDAWYPGHYVACSVNNNIHRNCQDLTQTFISHQLQKVD